MDKSNLHLCELSMTYRIVNRSMTVKGRRASLEVTLKDVLDNTQFPTSDTKCCFDCPLSNSYWNYSSIMRQDLWEVFRLQRVCFRVWVNAFTGMGYLSQEHISAKNNEFGPTSFHMPHSSCISAMFLWNTKALTRCTFLIWDLPISRTISQIHFCCL